MRPKPTQSDAEFVVACGCGGQPEAAGLAIALREDLAKYDQREPATVLAEATVVSTGILHPTDSIDLVDYSLMLEQITGVPFEPDEIIELLSPEREELTVRKWVRRLVSLSRAKRAAASGRT